MIGVFDSGFGGLHVLRGIAKELPEYGYVYAGDSARAPYGPKSVEEVYEFTKQGVEFLFAHGATFVILACNTASSEALRKIQQEYLREGSAKKVLGVLIPFAEAAAARTRNKRVGVLATEGTVRSGSFPREITKVDDDIEVFQQACPGLVPLVEAGKQDSKTAERLIIELKDKITDEFGGKEEGLREISKAQADVLDVLLALGYSRTEARDALAGLPKNLGSSEEKIREALRLLAKP